ncbi:hypothetical protein [Phycobacter sp. K97]|uniref:hypothetical protein n=1 Tax=Phycobacter sedimenti TaxID=3133977 RepID=UPI0031203A51
MALAAVATISPAAIAGELRLVDGPAVLTLHSRAKLSPDAETALRTLAESNFYGAFVVSRDGQGYAYNQGINSLKAARDLALMSCRSAGNSGCKIYATLAPKDYSPSRRDVTLSARNLDYFNATYRTRAAAGGYSAFAINGLGSAGYAANYKTAEEAEQRAIGECGIATAKLFNKPGIPLTPAQIMRSAKWKCRIVHQISPSHTD